MRLRNVELGDVDAYVRMRCDPVMMAELGGPLPREGIEEKVASDAKAAADDISWIVMVVPDEQRPDEVAGGLALWGHVVEGSRCRRSAGWCCRRSRAVASPSGRYGCCWTGPTRTVAGVLSTPSPPSATARRTGYAGRSGSPTSRRATSSGPTANSASTTGGTTPPSGSAGNRRGHVVSCCLGIVVLRCGQPVGECREGPVGDVPAAGGEESAQAVAVPGPQVPVM